MDDYGILYKKIEAQDKIINTQALEIARLKEIIYKARKMIFDNYGVLDKYEIELLDDVLKGDKENE
jgi:hypothetical protein